MERDFYKSPEPSKTMRFFWKAAGGDSYFLERSTYSDQVKYMCLGGIIVATGLMAALAGGYAFYTIFSPKGSAIEADTLSWPTTFISIIFGSFWGLMIFNLDRFIVSSTGVGDGTEAITWGELKGAIPRILMGAIIALTISKPVEIRMFKSEIDAALHEEQLAKQRDYEIRTRKTFEDRIKDLEKDNLIIENRINDYLKKISIKDSLYNVETSSGQGGRVKGEGPVAIALKNERDRLKVELDQYKKNNKLKIDDIESRRKKIYSELDKALMANKEVASGLDGLVERLKLSHQVSAPKLKDENGKLLKDSEGNYIYGFSWISLFITLLFLAIELTPIFFKLMLIKSPYDFLKQNAQELIKADQGIYIQYNYHKDKNGQERDLVTYLDKEKLLLEKRKLLKTQEELTDYALSKYKEDMIKKIDDNPESFIKSDSE